MNAITRTLVKNLVVAATLGLAALATWAVTESQAPAIETSAQR
ncbi:hypothetical protein [Ramlibacter sp. PS4R-6]